MPTTMTRRTVGVGIYAGLLAWAFERGGWANAAFAALVMATAGSLAYLFRPS